MMDVMPKVVAEARNDDHKLCQSSRLLTSPAAKLPPSATEARE